MGWRSEEAETGAWLAVGRVALGVLTLPVVAGFVALCVAVVAGRSLRDVAREAWLRRPVGSTTVAVSVTRAPRRDAA